MLVKVSLAADMVPLTAIDAPLSDTLSPEAKVREPPSVSVDDWTRTLALAPTLSVAPAFTVTGPTSCRTAGTDGKRTIHDLQGC